MTVCPLTVIPPKCTGVPITQLKKIFLINKSFFSKKKLFLVSIKPFLISISIFKNKKNKKIMMARPKIIRTYAEEENCEAIFLRSGSEFIILRITNTENCTFFGQKMTVILHTNMVALETFFFQ
jgi:hypothetical protein